MQLFSDIIIYTNYFEFKYAFHEKLVYYVTQIIRLLINSKNFVLAYLWHCSVGENTIVLNNYIIKNVGL